MQHLFGKNCRVQAVMIATLIAFAAYLIYRVGYTMNWEAPLLSILFFYAELHSFIGLSLFYFQVWDPIKRRAPSAPEGLSVEIWVPTLNEDVAVLRQTLTACMDIRYPHRTIVLDDGKRTDVRALAEELGCKYLARGDNSDAKAGNLNYALARSQADYICVFDADHVPKPDFLHKTLGYFHEERVAFVQTPQHYYNADSFVYHVDHERKEALCEIDIFYQLMMPGRDRWNAAFFVGTGCVFRRKALEDAGGFAVESITEDLLTSLHIYRKGWESRFHNELLATGLAPNDLKNYRSQKLRWCSGNVGSLLRSCPLWTPGLSWSQRLCFLGTLFGWCSGIPQLIYFITPPLVLLLGQGPFADYSWGLFAIHLGLLAMVLGGTKIAGRGYVRILDDVQYNMLNFLSLIQGIWRGVTVRCQRFQVTSKDHGHPSDPKRLLPQLAIVGISAIGGLWGLVLLARMNPEYFLSTAVASYWAWYHAILGILVLKKQLSHRFQRGHYRLTTRLPAEYHLRGEKQTRLGMIEDLTDSGLRLQSQVKMRLGDWVRLSLPLDQRQLACWGRVRYAGPGIYGISFHGLSSDDRKALSRFWFNTALPLFSYQYAVKPLAVERWWQSWWHQRVSPRRDYGRPVAVYTPAGERVLACSWDLSQGGLSFITAGQIPLQAPLRLELGLHQGTVTVPATAVRSQPLGASGLFHYGLKLDTPYPSFNDELAVDLDGADAYHALSNAQNR